MLFPGHFGGPASSASGKEEMQRRMAIDAVPGLSSDYPPFRPKFAAQSQQPLICWIPSIP